MVLLNASTISVAISSGIVCTFTFLLFLSGYVLQQQTVKSLQDALAAPIEVRVRVQPTLLPEVQNPDPNSLDASVDGNETSTTIPKPVQAAADTVDTVQIVLGSSEPVASTNQEPSIQELWRAHVDSVSVERPPSALQPYKTPSINSEDAFYGRFAYVLSLPNLKDLCSALLFTKWYRESSSLSRAQSNIIYLYPSDWESSPSSQHSAALRLLLQAEHKYSVLLHPVLISKVWTGIDVESQLLSELARNPWPYDRITYVRTPGMLLDTAQLDNTMLSTYIDPRILKTSWSKLRPPSRRTGAAALHPDFLLFAQGRGLMTPDGSLARSLTAQALVREDGELSGRMRDEFLAKEVAYVVFDEKELALRKRDRTSKDGIFERFERERGAVCEGTELLA